MSQVPRQVQAGEEEADRLIEELNKQRQQPSDAPPADATPPSDTAAQRNASETPTQSPPDSQGTPPAQEESWEHRYKVLQGKYDSEVPRLAQDFRSSKSRIAELEAELLSLKTASPTQPLVKPEEIEQYGPELIDIARRVAQEEIGKKQTEIDQLKLKLNQFQEVTTNTAERDFVRSLGELVPDWRQLNEDKSFLKWLDGIDEFTGATRQELLTRAEQARDAVRAAKFFTSFKQTSSTWAANSTQSLQQQVTPPTSQAAPTPPAKKIWTRPEIADFYSRVRRGSVSDKDVAAIEADINAALSEGRIR